MNTGDFNADPRFDSEPMISNDPLHGKMVDCSPYSAKTPKSVSLFCLYIRKHTHTLTATALWERS